MYDTKKRDPQEEGSLQAPAKFCEKFVLYDISTQKIVGEFPIKQFGHCLSAIYVFDGVLLTWVTNNKMEAISSISYINKQGIEKVCDLAITKFSLGPLLCRNNLGAIFSYTNELTNSKFGVKKITSDLNVEPLLTFTPEQSDNISDDIVASQDHYIYTVGEQDKVTFYVVTEGKTPIKFSLPEGEKLHSFGISSDWIIVSKSKPLSEGGGYFLERFDMKGNSLELYTLEQPLYYITGTNFGQFCGFNATTSFELFEITDSIQHIEQDSDIIDSRFNAVVSNGESYIVTSYEGALPRVWLVTLPV